MYVGNIITNSKIENDNFKICKDLNCIDDTLPTLIIGWDNTKKLLNGEVSILHKQIKNNLFWTFSNKERKSEYETDLDSFISFCYNSFGEHIPYVYLDLLYINKKINYRIIKKILSLEKSFTYITPTNMVYVYGENIIFGIDLNIVELFDGKKEKVINKITHLKNNTLIDSEIFNKCKDLIYKIKNKNRYIPYVYSYGIEK
jgi:hypothetical protein